MTLTDALNKAALMGLDATEEDSWCVLHQPGRGIAARGSSWVECFARLEAAEESARERAQRKPPEPPAVPPPSGFLF